MLVFFMYLIPLLVYCSNVISLSLFVNLFFLRIQYHSVMIFRMKNKY
jgi:hypothetical protein